MRGAQVRDPIDRFVSAAGELLKRYLNDVCPGDARCNIGEGEKQQAWTATHWWRLAQRQHAAHWPEAELPTLLDAFVTDVLCCHAANGMEQFLPQAAFATYARVGLDVILHLDNAQAALDEAPPRAGRARCPHRACGSKPPPSAPTR